MPMQRCMNLIMLLYRTSRQCSPFLSPKQVKQVYKLAEHLSESLLIMSAQCTKSFALTSLQIHGSKFGKANPHDFFSFTSRISTIPGPFGP